MPPITGPDTGGTETRANQPPALSWAGCSGDLPAVLVVDDRRAVRLAGRVLLVGRPE